MLQFGQGDGLAALLVGGKTLEKNFTLREIGGRDGLEWLEAIPKTADSGFEKIQIGFSGSDVKAMELFDNFGQMTSLYFNNIDRNPQLAASLFSFKPPAGVDVLGD